MSRKKEGGMLFVRCDAKDCDHDPFLTASDVKAKVKDNLGKSRSLIDVQLSLAGWTQTEVEIDRIGTKKRVDLCPGHRPKGRMSGGPPPLSVMGRTSH